MNIYILKKIQNFYIKLRISFNRFLNLYFINFYSKLDNDMSNNFKEALNELRLEGITKLPVKLDCISELDIKEFISKKEKSFEELIIIKNLYKNPDKNGKIVASLDVNSSIINELFTKDLFLLLKNYYGKRFWLRNAPTLLADLKNHRIEEKSQNLFHIDFAERQLSIMVLLDDVTEKSTYMEYIKKSQKNAWVFKNITREGYKFKKKINDELNKKDIDIFKMIGKKGDVFIFDAGNGLHRAVYGDDRYILHFNFAQMRAYAEFNNNYEINKDVNNLENFYHWNFEFNNNTKQKLKENLFEEKNLKWS
jgi:hypothetical protein